MAPSSPALDARLLERFFNPRAVAIVGASSNPAGFAGRASVNLERTGYTGRVHLVNPARESIDGRTTVPSLAAVDDDELDAAVVLVRAEAVLDAVRECAERGVPAISVCTAGFRELGESGREAERELARIARESGSRVLGPNCLGVLSVVDGYIPVPTYNITYRYTPGGVTFLSHSGGLAVTVFNRAQGREIGVRGLVTLGNEADLEVAEVIEALVEDERTRVIAVFLERVTEGERFLRAVRKAHEARKPVVVLKAGSSEAGARAVAGHTGRLAGEHAVYTGLFDQAGVIQASSIDELLDTAHVFDVLPRPRGRRLGVFTMSGGESSYVADRAGPLGLELPPPAEETVERLLELSSFVVPGNPFDATGQVIGNPEYTRAALEAYCADPGFDLLALVTETWGEHDANHLLPVIIDAATAAHVPAVICSWSARNHTERAWEHLRASGVTAFETSDQGVAALANLCRYWLDTSHVGTWARTRVQPAAAPAPGLLDEHDGKLLLAAAGVPMVEEALCADRPAAREAFAHLGAPAVCKLLAEGVVHKSDAGLVRLGIRTEEELEAALDELDRAGRSTRGYLVQRQLEGVEIVFGGLVDPAFGPVVMVGAGGLLAEHEPDVRFVAVPATRAELEAAVDGLRVRPVLEGLRGRRPDVPALVDALEAFAAFVDGARDWLGSCDVNPVIVLERGEGVRAVDAALGVRSADPRR